MGYSYEILIEKVIIASKILFRGFASARIRNFLCSQDAQSVSRIKKSVDLRLFASGSGRVRSRKSLAAIWQTENEKEFRQVWKSAYLFLTKELSRELIENFLCDLLSGYFTDILMPIEL